MGRKGKEKVPEVEAPSDKRRKTRSSTTEKGQSSGQRRSTKSIDVQIPVTKPTTKEIPKHHLENKYNIFFGNSTDVRLKKERQERYDILFERGMMSTRFLDTQLMCDLGLDDNLQWMFERLGLAKLWGAHYDTYPKYVYEFLCTLSVKNRSHKSSEKRGIEFCLDGEDYSLTAKEISEIYGFHEGGVIKEEKSITGEDFWPCISEDEKFASSSSKCSSIRNPVFRCFQKAIANTILARGDSQNVMRTEEIYFIWACFQPNLTIDMGYHFINQLRQVASRTKGTIMIGGMLTPIFKHFKINVSMLETASGSNVLGYEVFHASHLFVRRQKSIYLQDPFILLPCFHRLDISDPGNWKIGENDDEDEEMEDDEVNEEGDEQAQEGEDEGGNDVSQRNDDDAFNMRDVHSSLRELREEQRRTNATLAQLETRHQRLEERFDTMYTWNEAIYHHFFPPPPPPTE